MSSALGVGAAAAAVTGAGSGAGAKTAAGAGAGVGAAAGTGAGGGAAVNTSAGAEYDQIRRFTQVKYILEDFLFLLTNSHTHSPWYDLSTSLISSVLATSRDVLPSYMPIIM